MVTPAGSSPACYYGLARPQLRDDPLDPRVLAEPAQTVLLDSENRPTNEAKETTDQKT